MPLGYCETITNNLPFKPPLLASPSKNKFMLKRSVLLIGPTHITRNIHFHMQYGSYTDNLLITLTNLISSSDYFEKTNILLCYDIQTAKATNTAMSVLLGVSELLLIVSKVNKISRIQKNKIIIIIIILKKS